MKLVNAQHVKILPGRKSDVLDAEWLAELLEHGLLRGSFVPPAAIRELRDLTRYRKRLIQAHTSECQRIQKTLTVRTEVTDRMLIFGERHLHQVLAVYAAHYNTARPHRALRLRPPRPTSPVPEPVHSRIRSRPILGGLLNKYEAAA